MHLYLFLTFMICASIVDYMKKNPHLGDEPIDIEDLVNVGRRFGP